VKIALDLAELLKVGVNDLPLHLVLSWVEQKAVVILLTLLYLGVKNIVIGPSLPAFLTPVLVDYLVRNFDLQPMSNNKLFTAKQPLSLMPEPIDT
jgi:hydroxylamine reductase